MSTTTSVGINNNLTTRKTCITVRTTDNELACGVYVQDIIIANKIGQTITGALQTSLHAGNQDILHIVTNQTLHHLLSLLLRTVLGRSYELIVLCRYNDRVYTDRVTCSLVVLHRHLALGIGTQVGHSLTRTTDVGQLLKDYVRKDKRCGHILAGLVAGIAKHNTLIASALSIIILTLNALINI